MTKPAAVVYLKGNIGQAVVPAGAVVVHNHVRPAPRLGTRGFRAWLTDATDPSIAVCRCEWAPEIGRHFRMKPAGG